MNSEPKVKMIKLILDRYYCLSWHGQQRPFDTVSAENVVIKCGHLRWDLAWRMRANSHLKMNSSGILFKNMAGTQKQVSTVCAPRQLLPCFSTMDREYLSLEIKEPVWMLWRLKLLYRLGFLTRIDEKRNVGSLYMCSEIWASVGPAGSIRHHNPLPPHPPSTCLFILEVIRHHNHEPRCSFSCNSRCVLLTV